MLNLIIQCLARNKRLARHLAICTIFPHNVCFLLACVSVSVSVFVCLSILFKFYNHLCKYYQFIDSLHAYILPCESEIKHHFINN